MNEVRNPLSYQLGYILSNANSLGVQQDRIGLWNPKKAFADSRF